MISVVKSKKNQYTPTLPTTFGKNFKDTPTLPVSQVAYQVYYPSYQGTLPKVYYPRYSTQFYGFDIFKNYRGAVRWYRLFFPLYLIFFENFTCTFETPLFRNKIAQFSHCTLETPLFRKLIFSQNNPNFHLFCLKRP